MENDNIQVSKWSRQLGQFVMVGQLGLSLIAPLLICLFICCYLVSHSYMGTWIYIPGFILGLGGSGMTAWKVYRSIVLKEQKKKSSERGSKEISFSRHH